MRTRLWASLLLATSLTVLLAIEAGGRVYYWSRSHLSPWLTPSELIYSYYPELKQVMPNGKAGRPRVLLLGASVLNQTFSDIRPLLREALKQAWKQEVDVVNLAMLGHSSLDSYYKYRLLGDEPFDLVFLYHGINELRANNVPPELWREDYGHYAWYAKINFYFRHESLQRLPMVFPYFLKQLAIDIDRSLMRRNRYVPEHSPHPAWVAYGAEIKSAPVFRQNLERILGLAAVKNDPVVLMTFAYHLPPDYSLARFQRGELGYGSWANSSPSAVEIWGAPDHVLAGLQLHNRILREMHETHRDTLFVDQAALLGGEPENFVDICHFSPVGAQRFVDNVMDVVRTDAVPRRFTVPDDG